MSRARFHSSSTIMKITALSPAPVRAAFAAFAVLMLSGLLATQARALDCTDYSRYLRWVAGIATGGRPVDVVVSGSYAYVADGDLTILDISNPALPVVAGQVTTMGSSRGIAVSGEYAYLAALTVGLQMVDISDPSMPAIIGTANTPGNAYGVAVSGSTAYVADYNGGLQVVDCSDPAWPAIIGSLTTPGDAWAVAVRDSTVYLADGASGLLAIDVSVPSAPVIAGSRPTIAQGVTLAGSHAFVAASNQGVVVIDVTDPSLPIVGQIPAFNTIVRDVAVSGSYAHICAAELGLVIADISDLGSPQTVGVLGWPASEAWGIALAGDFAYVCNGASGLQVIDIDNPAAAPVAGAIDLPEAGTDAVVTGTTAYIASGHAGLHMVDVSNPLSPVLIGTANTPGYALGVDVAGSYAGIADDQSGLTIVDISLPDVVSTLPMDPAWDVALAGDLAYVTCNVYSLEQGLFHVVSISDPLDPQIVATLSDSPSAFLGVDYADPHLYVADGVFGLRIYDLSTPANPVPRGALPIPGGANDVAVQNNLAYLAVNTGLSIADVAAPDSPVLLGTATGPGGGSRVTVAGDFAYLAAEEAGLSVFDVSDPSQPLLLGGGGYVPGFGISRAHGVASADGFLVVAGDWVLTVANGCTVITSSPLPAPERGGGLTLSASPNPAFSDVRMFFELPHPGRVRISIADVLGRRVRVLRDAVMPAGQHVAAWDGRNDSGQPVARGTYLLSLISAGGEAANRRVTVLR